MKKAKNCIMLLDSISLAFIAIPDINAENGMM